MTRFKLALVSTAFAITLVSGWAEPSSAKITGLNTLANVVAPDDGRGLIVQVHSRKRMHKHRVRRYHRARPHSRNRGGHVRQKYARTRKLRHNQYDTRLLFGALGLFF